MKPLLQVEDLTVHRDDVTAVVHADLEVGEGGITALLGPSGCGKTSLLRAVAGFETPAAGCIRLNGELLAGPGRWVAPEKRRIGMVFQEGALFPHLSVRRNILYGLRGREDDEGVCREALELVGMAGFEDRYPDQLSGGQQQRIALARALSPRPRMVLLDEPFANLDATLRRRVREEVRAILEAAGITAVLVTHDQEEALSVAGSVAVMIDGRIVQAGSPEQVYHDPATPEVARFVGEGQLVRCTVRDGRVDSVFGPAGSSASDGPGLLMVRPEDLRVLPEFAEEGVPGRVLPGRRFFGHDLLDEVRLETGETVEVRSLSSNCPAPGARVRPRLRKKRFRVFPV